MTELRLTLDVECCQCDEGIHVTVKCEGKGLLAGPRTIAAVKVPCPACGRINQICFHPTGSVVRVQALGQLSCMMLPSAN